MFLDEVVIFTKSGKGGDGIVHFRREKYIPRGGPDGGDGGRGGDVILRVFPTLNTLSSFRQNKRFLAPAGSKGGVSNQTGKSAEDLIIPVPPGTIVINKITGVILDDLVESDQQLIVCAGGRGGRGNARFATSRNQTPRIAEKGEPGQELELRLELKLIADVGIIGVPNAGKSTLLSVISNAKPKIGAYPFTTLEPNLGVVDLDGEHSMICADIPGLIEGAHEGIGLGFAFLRHIQRTSVLIHLLDGLAEDPIADFFQINSEMALFDPKLAEKPQIVVFNKIDLPDVKSRWITIKKELAKQGFNTMAISAITKEGVRKALFAVSSLLADIPKESRLESPLEYTIETDPRAFEIHKIDDGWKITGQAIERAAAMTYWEYDQSVRRFQRILETLGIAKALLDAGVQSGETVFISDFELEWQN